MDGQAFEDGLLSAYRGERAAVVTLRCFQQLPLSELEHRLVELLVAVETIVGDQLEPLVRLHGLPTALDDELIERARMRAGGMASWHALVESFDHRLEGYLTGFRALQKAASPADRDGIDLLVEHEIALTRFGALLRSGADEQAEAVLLSVIRRGRADIGPIEPEKRPNEAGTGI